MRKYFISTQVLLFVVGAGILLGCKRTHHHAVAVGAEGEFRSLVQGNKRFYSEHPSHPHDDIATVKQLSDEQHPGAVVISCSDSRVSPELIFDQGLGDLFVIRTAGNIIGGIEIGSVEYAIAHFDIKLVVVMGHQQCGAIQAYLDDSIAPGHIKDIVDSIANEAEIRDIHAYHRNNNADLYVRANVLHGMRQLTRQSDIIRERLLNQEIQVVGAVYKINEGKVEFIQ